MKERDHLVELVIDGITLKWIFMKHGVDWIR
jgi:hypothetical protein